MFLIKRERQLYRCISEVFHRNIFIRWPTGKAREDRSSHRKTAKFCAKRFNNNDGFSVGKIANEGIFRYYLTRRARSCECPKEQGIDLFFFFFSITAMLPLPYAFGKASARGSLLPSISKDMPEAEKKRVKTNETKARFSTFGACNLFIL